MEPWAIMLRLHGTQVKKDPGLQRGIQPTLEAEVETDIRAPSPLGQGWMKS